MDKISENLVSAIKNSIVLKEKLSQDQIEKFVKKALTIADEGKIEMTKKIKEDDNYFIEKSKEQNEMIENYKKEMSDLETKFKKEVKKEKEDKQNEIDEKLECELLKELDNY